MIGVDFGGLRKYGKNSSEKQIHAERVSEKIMCYYSRDYQIPDQPKINKINTEKTERTVIQIPTEVETNQARNPSSTFQIF